MNIPLHELKRMMEAASPAPWRVHEATDEIRSVGGSIGGEHQVPACVEDDQLIAAMRNALPSLLAVVEAAQDMQRAGAVYGPFQEGDLERAFDALDVALAPFQGKEVLP